MDLEYGEVTALIMPVPNYSYQDFVLHSVVMKPA